jgi:hypothetical protein
VDAIGVGRDVGALWCGEQSAESLLCDRCHVPDLGRNGPVFRQIARTRDGADTLIRYNGGGSAVEALAPQSARIEKAA